MYSKQHPACNATHADEQNGVHLVDLLPYEGEGEQTETYPELPRGGAW